MEQAVEKLSRNQRFKNIRQEIADRLSIGEVVTSDDIREMIKGIRANRFAVAQQIKVSVVKGNFQDETGIAPRIFKVETTLVFANGSQPLSETNFHQVVAEIREQMSRPSELVMQLHPIPDIKTYRLEQINEY